MKRLNKNLELFINNKLTLHAFDEFSRESLDLSRPELRQFKDDILTFVNGIDLRYLDDSVVKFTISYKSRYELNYYRINNQWCLGFINVEDIFD